MPHFIHILNWEKLKVFKKAAKAGINFKVVNSDEGVEKYVNKGNGNRSEDLITDFSYIGHGAPDRLLLGHDEYREGTLGQIVGATNDYFNSLDLSEFDKSAFSTQCDISLNACGAKTTMIWGGKGLGSSAPFDKKYYPYGDPRREDPNRATLPANQRTRTEQGQRED